MIDNWGDMVNVMLESGKQNRILSLKVIIVPKLVRLHARKNWRCHSDGDRRTVVDDSVDDVKCRSREKADVRPSFQESISGRCFSSTTVRRGLLSNRRMDIENLSNSQLIVIKYPIKSHHQMI